MIELTILCKRCKNLDSVSFENPKSAIIYLQDNFYQLDICKNCIDKREKLWTSLKDFRISILEKFDQGTDINLIDTFSEILNARNSSENS